MATQPNALVALNSTYLSAEKQVQERIDNGSLVVPPNYQVGNALKSAHLHLMDYEDLALCTQASIGKALLQYAIMGLDINKGQCYFFRYGSSLTCFRSYQGNKMLAKRIDPTIEDIVTRPVKKGEKFEFVELPNGYSEIIDHQRTLETMDSKDYLAGYATIIYNDGKPPKTLIMTWNRIKKSWLKSKMKPVNPVTLELKPNTTHADYTDDMLGRTLINAITKSIIKSSDDQYLYDAMTANELTISQAIANEEITEETADVEVVDFDDNPEVIEAEAVEVEVVEATQYEDYE